MGERMTPRLEKGITVVERVAPIAAELGCTMAQLALAWTMANPDVSTAMVGASNLAQLKDSLGVISVVGKLTPDVMKRIDEAAETVPDWDEITRQVRGTRRVRPRL